MNAMIRIPVDAISGQNRSEVVYSDSYHYISD